MPWSLTVVPSGVDVRFTGLVTGEDFYVANTELLAHARRREPEYAVIDFTGATQFTLEVGDTIRIVDHDREYLRDRSGFPLVVVGRDMLRWTLLYTVLLPKNEFPAQLVATRRDAIEWLQRHGCNADGLPAS